MMYWVVEDFMHHLPTLAVLFSVSCLGDEVPTGSEGVVPTPVANSPDEIDLSGTHKGGWSDARMGWMTRTLFAGGAEVEVEVEEVREKAVLFRMTTRLEGRDVGVVRAWEARYEKKIVGSQDDDAEVVELADETLWVGDERILCQVKKTIHRSRGDDVTTTVWTNRDIPGWVVKRESDAGGVGMRLVSTLKEHRKGAAEDGSLQKGR